MNKEEINNIGEVQIKEIGTEMKDSYIDYAMSVIVSRALPDVRDGLKPVQRRILYAMYGMGARHDTKFRKSAAVTGEVLGKYHPHGDASVYAALVRMAQDFSLRYPFIRGQGNFGSIDGDPPAAQRYTECKLNKIGEEMLTDIEKETVEVMDNYDATRTEPRVLPAPLPSLLLNGTTGIAVGMATNIAPHNLNEVCEALAFLIDNEDAEQEEILKFIQGPDFPTRGFVFDSEAIKAAYSQGKGSFVMRGKIEIIEKEKNSQIIITEIPYQVDKSVLVTSFANLVQNKKIEGIKDIRDESDKDGMRIAIDLQKGAIPKKILNSLYKYTDLQKTFHLNMIALVNGIEPKLLSLKEILVEYLKHRKDVLLRRTKFELDKAKQREHILEGLVSALDKIDKIIETIKKSKTKEDAKNNLVNNFKLTIIQAEAILEIKLHQLARLEKEKLEDELKELLARIKDLEELLKNDAKQKTTLKKELKFIQKTYGDERRTVIVPSKPDEISVEDLVPEEESIISVTKEGYIKRMNPDEYKGQHRGGVGVSAMKTREEDEIEHFLHANTHDTLLFFTDSGKVFRTKAYEVPEGSKANKGRGIMNFLEISSNDKILSILPIRKGEEKTIDYLMMITKKGVIKKTKIKEFENVRRGGLIAINLKPEDSLRQVEKVNNEDSVLIATRNGMSIRFQEKDVRPMGRTAAGIRGIRLQPKDEVVGMEIVREGNEESGILILSENGYGKITKISEYKIQKRGGSGIKISNVTEKTGKIVKPAMITDQESLIVISQKGITIKTTIASIPKLGRTTQGVKIMKLKAGDKVASATCL